MTIRTAIKTLLAASFMAGTCMTPAAGQEETRQFSAKSGEQVNHTLELASAEKYEDALATLERLITDTGLVAYERSTIYQMIGQYSYELDRPIDAQKAFENAIKAGGLLPEEIDNIKIIIAQMMIGNGQYREGAERLEAYLSAGGEEKAQHVELLVQSWLQAEDYPRALPWAEKWCESASPRQRKHYDLMNFLYVELGMPDTQIEIIKEMIERWPDDTTLWDSLVSVLANSGQEKEAFEVTRVMYQSGLLKTESEILTLVKYHNYYEMPFQAAEILEREVETGLVRPTPENLREIAALFRRARLPERGLPYLERVASENPQPEYKIDFAEGLLKNGQCERAGKVFSEVKPKDSKIWMQIGMCHVDTITKFNPISCNLSDEQIAAAPISKAREMAVAAFDQVPNSSVNYDLSQKWLDVVRAEQAAVERRCGHTWRDYTRELCYQRIKQAYDALIFGDGFKLDDKSCEEYVPEYDAEFRRNQSDE